MSISYFWFFLVPQKALSTTWPALLDLGLGADTIPYELCLFSIPSQGQKNLFSLRFPLQ